MATKTGKGKAAREQAANALQQPEAQAPATAAHLDAPAAAAHPAAEQSSGVVHSEAKAAGGVKPGTVALVGKACDRIPVQLKDEAHLEQLRKQHGEANVEVQS